jgi:hypothetical protein
MKTLICPSCLNLANFLKAFLLACVAESTVLYLLVSKETAPRILRASLVANGTSLPIVWFVFPFLMTSYNMYALLSETFAVLYESFILRILLSVSWRRSLVAAFAMNMTSFVIGWFLASVLFA